MRKQRDYTEVNWNDLVYYDESNPTGLRWLDSKFNKKQVIHLKDSPAGYWAGKFYTSIKVGSKTYQVHRVIMQIHGNNLNGMVVDHIDGDTRNNKYSNLRLVSSAVNHRNKKPRNKSTTGFTGVTYDKINKRYKVSHVELNGKKCDKYFSETKLGNDAFRLACEYRTSVIDRLNDEGAGYTDHHKSHHSSFAIQELRTQSSINVAIKLQCLTNSTYLQHSALLIDNYINL